MSMKPKTIAFTVAALLAAAGGGYAFLSDSADTAGAIAADSAQTAAKPADADVQATTGAQSPDKTAAPDAAETAAQNPVTPGQPAVQAPKKLTKQQLTPPPATEEEKLQKAAEQESNF